MFKYKYINTMLAMAVFNIGAGELQKNNLAISALVLTLGALMIIVEAIFIVFSKGDLKAQTAQWLFEISLFLLMISYSVVDKFLFEGVLVLVAGVGLLIAYALLVLWTEMSKIE